MTLPKLVPGYGCPIFYTMDGKTAVHQVWEKTDIDKGFVTASGVAKMDGTSIVIPVGNATLYYEVEDLTANYDDHVVFHCKLVKMEEPDSSVLD